MIKQPNESEHSTLTSTVHLSDGKSLAIHTNDVSLPPVDPLERSLSTGSASLVEPFNCNLYSLWCITVTDWPRVYDKTAK